MKMAPKRNLECNHVAVAAAGGISPASSVPSSHHEEQPDVQRQQPGVEAVAATPTKKVRLNVENGEEECKILGDASRSAEANAKNMVTPAAHRERKPATFSNSRTHESGSDARRALFSAASATPNLVTPSRTQTDPPPFAKRKLVFGKWVDEMVIQKNVSATYQIVRKLTGSIGGNACHGPIYGELTKGSMQKMVNLMKQHTDLNASSRFIDVGSGIGKPNLHVTQDPGVEFSYGIEIEEDRWLLGMNCLKGVLDAATKQQRDASTASMANNERLLHKCFFELGDITNAKVFDPFTHVYMFSIGFPPRLWIKLADIWNRSSSPYMICYHGPRNIIDSYEFDVELIAQTPTSMHGSKEGHMGYIYRRTKKPETTSAATASASTNVTTSREDDGEVFCDPLFANACNLVNQGLDALKERVDATLEEKMRPTRRRTRSTRETG